MDFIEDFISEKCLSKCIYNKYSEKDRIIIIPGNHDVVRELRSGDKFGGDKLKSFKRNIAAKKYNTPLGSKKKYCYTEKEKQKEICLGDGILIGRFI